MKGEHIQLVNTLDMKHVMNSENIEELKNLLQFVSIIMKYFSEVNDMTCSTYVEKLFIDNIISYFHMTYQSIIVNIILFNGILSFI